MANSLDSAFFCSKYVLPYMIPQGAGKIINISSIHDSVPRPRATSYCASKAGLLMLTRSLTLEYGQRDIRVNAVSPGLIAREGIEADWPDGVTRWLQNAPLQRMGLANDVADAVLFLLSPASRWISGINLVVDGGMSTVSRW
jgi:NAD(P)-dependent dehydrogenase (short-subunit alcohol dehydrogenase family)